MGMDKIVIVPQDARDRGWENTNHGDVLWRSIGNADPTVNMMTFCWTAFFCFVPFMCG